MRTVSLRRRVTATATVVSGLMLIGVAVLVHLLFAMVADRSENTILTDRVQLARQLATQDTAPGDFIARVDNRSVRARLVLTDGRSFGSLPPPHEPVAEPTRHVQLAGPGDLNHAHLALQLDTPLLTHLQARLGRLLALATAAAILLIAGALWFGVRRALAPLDSMTDLAREIARGRRGRRLSPDRTDTELGRTAGAFDEMLDALEGAEARARASEQQLRDFVGDAAHELRTPVAGIRAIAEAVLHRPADADPEEREQMLMLLVREAARAGRLVDDLLDMARINAGLPLHTAPIDLYDLVATHVDRVRVLHPGIVFALHGVHVTVVADPERIGQVVVNVLANACQAMAGHRPDTYTETRTDAVDVRIDDLGDTAEITIGDTGPGVPDVERERIFERMVRLDPARAHRAEGSGLGLAVARGIARAHGGDLSCAAQPVARRGASFVLRLPVGPVPEPTVPEPRDPAAPGLARRELARLGTARPASAPPD